MENKKTKNNQTTATVILTIVIILAVMSYARGIVNPLLMALFTGIILAQPIRWLEKKKLPHWLAISIAIIVFLITYLAFFQFLAASWSLFVENSSKYEDNLGKIIQSALGNLSQMGVDVSSVGDTNFLTPEKVIKFSGVVIRKLGGLMSRNFAFLLLTIFLLTEDKSIVLKIRSFGKGTADSIDSVRTVGDSIRHYLSIKTVTSLFTGVLIAIGLALIGVDFPILWGLVAFLLNYIPNIGSGIATIPAVALALVQLGPDGALWTAGLFLSVNLVIGSIVEPRMMGKGMGLSTFVVFFSLLFWGFILGPIGMFLSVPLTMVIKIITARNPNTKWIAIILGKGDEAISKLEGDTGTTAADTINHE